MNTKIINIINKETAKAKNISIIMHVNPDGDAVGASLALYGILSAENHKVSIISPNEFPAYYGWMPFSENILIHKAAPQKAEDILLNSDLIFCLDFNDITRMADVADGYKKSKAIKFLIDHHPESSVFTDYAISDINTSSASELLYDVIIALNKKHLINKEIAECIYVGILTDTGSFSYSCNHEKTYRTVADLINRGIDGEHIHHLVYSTYSENRLRLTAFSLCEKLKILKSFGAAYIGLTKEELQRFQYKAGDTEGLVNIPLSMDEVNFSVIFMEMEDNIRVSLRSKGSLNVNEIAKKYYHGGGHQKAAGGHSYKNMTETLAEFEANLPEILKII